MSGRVDLTRLFSNFKSASLAVIIVSTGTDTVGAKLDEK